MRMILIFLLLVNGTFLFSQNNQWTWLQGDINIPKFAVYGTKGVAGVDNTPGGRRLASHWTDTSGNFWLFGGVGYSDTRNVLLNDLWKYSPLAKTWTWVTGDTAGNQLTVYGSMGMAAVANKPGSRTGAANWTDASGNLWLFGGEGNSGSARGNMSDIWMFAPSTGLWTWIGGDTITGQSGVYGNKATASTSTKPGARNSAVTWADTTGNLWLFGGDGYAGGYQSLLNDLWKYNISTGLWTWMSGDKTVGGASVYGQKGSPGPAYKPGARELCASWMDAAGDLWLLGGYGNESNTGNAYMNDMWKYTALTGEWAWVSGDNTANQLGAYGAQGLGATSNKPGGRMGPVSWTDMTGNMWLCGGNGFAASGLGSLNDLWKYVPSTGKWTWVSGDNTIDQAGIYGTKGSPSIFTKPGSRGSGTGWLDATGNLWLFGGNGLTTRGTASLNDLWKFTTASEQWTWVGGDNSISLSGVYGQQGMPSSSNKPGGRNGAVSWKDLSGNLWVFGGYGNAGNGEGNLNDLWKYTVSTGQWTWIGGSDLKDQPGTYTTKNVADASGKPGSRQFAVGWTDPSGNLLLFGGYGITPNGTGSMNDLWKYDLSTGQWTWISGNNTTYQPGVYGTRGTPAAANQPGSRQQAVGWADAAGNMWLFGGNGQSSGGSGFLNDLWKYSPSLGQWTWVSGSNLSNAAGFYGVMNVSSPDNKPGPRWNSTTWTDAIGNLWLFGGQGTATDGYGSLSDLWQFTISTGAWTWMSGDTVVNQTGVYGTQGMAATSNKPASRTRGASWTDTYGNLWILGGDAYIQNGSKELNDFWKYVPSAGQWTWMGGDSISYQKGIYGTQGTASASNIPGSRRGALSWLSSTGNLLLFGGYGFAARGSDYLNDLWQYTVPGSALPVQFNRFSARKQDKDVLLSWSVVHEQNSRYYSVQRSPDGSAFDSIGSVGAVVATSYTASYTFADQTPLQGDNFYRLKQVDKDGSFRYSTVTKIVINAKDGQFTIGQNPVQGILQLKVELPSPQKLTLQVTDISGHVLLSKMYEGSKGLSGYSISVSHLAKGAYMIHVQSESINGAKAFIRQ